MKFKNNFDLAASLIVDLERAREKVIDTNSGKDVMYSPFFAYQFASKKTSEEQDENCVESEVIFINAKSLDSVDSFSEESGWQINQSDYDDLLKKLIQSFDDLDFKKFDGNVGRFVMFNS
jgi:hypothetical protein